MSEAKRNIRQLPPTSGEVRADLPLQSSSLLDIRLVRVWRGELLPDGQEGPSSWLMLHCIEGAGRFTHRNVTTDFRKGDLVLIPSGVKPNLEPGSESGRWEMVWVSFFPYPHWFSLLQWPEEAPELRALHFGDADCQNRLGKGFLEALRLRAGEERNREASAMNELERLLLFCDSTSPDRKESQVDSRVLFAVNYLNQHLAEPVTLSLLAQVVGLSVPRLGQLFRRHIHLSPHRFLENQRIAHARRILETSGDTVSIVAAAAGYSDPFHFARQFKKHVGCSPSEYRRRQLTASGGNG